VIESTRPFEVGPGWAAFADTELYLRFAFILLAATLSSVVLAYHPVHRTRAVSLDELDLRKTLIIYGVVGALIAIICTVSPSMAFVIFGIGGLMRFRTDVGASKHTGHTIMATLIGLCWGLGLQLVATIATVFFWLMIFVLESAPPRELTVAGVELADMGRAADAYAEAVARAGGRLLGHVKDFKRGQLKFVVSIPNRVTDDELLIEFNRIPERLRGTPDLRG
jgi:hypothetical protein